MRQGNRRTFRAVLDSSRVQAAESAWRRARHASELRHFAASSGNGRAARKLGEIKKAAIALAVNILPERVAVTIDRSYHVGFVSIRFTGRGGLHLPPGQLNVAHDEGQHSDSLT